MAATKKTFDLDKMPTEELINILNTRTQNDAILIVCSSGIITKGSGDPVKIFVASQNSDSVAEALCTQAVTANDFDRVRQICQNMNFIIVKTMTYLEAYEKNSQRDN